MKKSITDIAGNVPSNLRFGIIVAVAFFWAEFLRMMFLEIFTGIFASYSGLAVSFVLAIMATLTGLAVFYTYRKIVIRANKIRI